MTTLETERTIDANRRLDRRVGRIVEVWTRDGGGHFQKNRAVEVAGCGARVVLPGAYNHGDQVDITFKTDQGAFVTVVASVVWTRPLHGGRRHIVGVTFQPAPADRVALDRWIQDLSNN